MPTTQALIAIGGKATRIRARGIPVSLSKSFLPVCGKPLLYWNLISLYVAGVRRLILCGNDALQLREAELLLDGIGVVFHQVHLVQDPGLGVHGLPYQVIYRNPELLDETFIFECGHSLMRPIHYLRLMQAKAPGAVVFSAFTPHPANLRQPVRLNGGHVELVAPGQPGRQHALAHPLVADRCYARQLPLLGFSVTEIIAYYAREHKLRYVLSEMPPEFDIAEEMQEAYQLYESYLTRQGLTRSPLLPAASR